MSNHILYHENSQSHPDHPQEDAYAYLNNVYVVADGVTHDLDKDQNYPEPSDAALVAKIICDEITLYLQNKKASLDEIKNAFILANTKVNEFNQARELYKNREDNGYSFGAATVSMVWILEGKLLYGVLDDCFISVFGQDLVDHPILESFVEKSAKYLDRGFDWQKTETRKMWRKEIRNNKFIGEDGKEYGYGVIDGRDGFLPFLQLGEVALNSGDLVCVYTDGFIKMMQNLDFIKAVSETEFTSKIFEFIEQECRRVGVEKEKTGYFIKI